MSLPVVNSDLCTACGICAASCPSACYDMGDVAILARPDDCTSCEICVYDCPAGAIVMG